MKRLGKSAKWTSIFLSMLILMLAQLTPLQAMELRSSNSTDLTSSSAQCSDGFESSTDEYSGAGYQFDSSGSCVDEHLKPDFMCVVKTYDWTIDEYDNCFITQTGVVRFGPTTQANCPDLDTCPSECGIS